MPCHNATIGCPAGLDSSPLCPACQADLERGVWWRREGEAETLQYRHDADARGSIIAMALECKTLEEALIVLAMTAVEQPRSA